MNQDVITQAVNTIRMMAVDGTRKANSGHPGMPMGMADCAFVLWNQFLKYNPKDPEWPNRDRFVLSAGHGSMLLYTMLYLSGYDVTLNDLKNFRQWESRTPGHPEYGCLPGVETTTGPLGQGFANGVGMAIASKIVMNRFNKPKSDIIGHHIYAIVSDGDLMEGVASESASLAGHLRLGNIIYIYDDNAITIEGETKLAFSEDVAKRFQSYGWHTVKIDGHNHDEIAGAIEKGIKEDKRPTLILTKTHIGFGSPDKQDTASVHGSPLSEEEVVRTKENLKWPLEPTFYVPDAVHDLFKKRTEALKPLYDKWQETFKAWQKEYPEDYKVWKTMRAKKIPDGLDQALIDVLPDKPTATRSTGGKVLNAAAKVVPSLYGGSADLAPSTKTLIDNSDSIAPIQFSGRNLHFGIREHGMGGIINGMALYGGFIPYGATFLVFSDYMRPSIRLAALMNIQVIYVFTHDSIFVGEDGPTHQPIEHVAALRTIPGLMVFRPADALETAMSWAYALHKKDGPTALCLTRQNLPDLERSKYFDPKTIKNGGYIISKEKGEHLDAVLVASGSEVEVALKGKMLLEEKGKSIRVVSMPSLDVFQKQSQEYRDSVIPKNGLPVAVVEAGIAQGWQVIARGPFLFIGMDHFGASAPYQVLAEKFGFTGEAVCEMVSCWLDSIG
jgi:transketolase